VSGVRQELTGTAFTMFDFTPVGALLAVVGVVFLGLFYWLLPERKREQSGLDKAIEIKNYTTEARVLPDSTAIGRTVADLHAAADGAAMVTGIVSAAGRRRTPLPDVTLRAG